MASGEEIQIHADESCAQILEPSMSLGGTDTSMSTKINTPKKRKHHKRDDSARHRKKSRSLATTSTAASPEACEEVLVESEVVVVRSGKTNVSKITDTKRYHQRSDKDHLSSKKTKHTKRTTEDRQRDAERSHERGSGGRSRHSRTAYPSTHSPERRLTRSPERPIRRSPQRHARHSPERSRFFQRSKSLAPSTGRVRDSKDCNADFAESTSWSSSRWWQHGTYEMGRYRESSTERYRREESRRRHYALQHRGGHYDSGDSEEESRRRKTATHSILQRKDLFSDHLNNIFDATSVVCHPTDNDYRINVQHLLARDALAKGRLFKQEDFVQSVEELARKLRRFREFHARHEGDRQALYIDLHNLLRTIHFTCEPKGNLAQYGFPSMIQKSEPHTQHTTLEGANPHVMYPTGQQTTFEGADPHVMYHTSAYQHHY